MIKRELKVQLNFENDDVQAIAIPYKNKDFRMWFFLPKEVFLLFFRILRFSVSEVF